MKKLCFISMIILLFTSLGVVSASAQVNQNRCYKQCSREAKKELRNCKNLSKDCINQNILDPLTVLEYCTDSFTGACESNINDTFRSCLTNNCGLDITAFRNTEEFDDLNGIACSTDGGNVVNPILTDIQNIVNQGWETAACKENLCPFGSSSDPVYSGKIAVGCGANEAALDATCCSFDDCTYPACEGFHVDVTVESINGIQDLVFQDFAVTDVTGAIGTQTCPYDSNADGGSFECSYYGTGTGSAFLQSGAEIKMVDTEFKVRLKCSDGFGSIEKTLYNGSFTCTTSNPTAQVTYDFCAGRCLFDPLKGVMTYLQIPSKKDLKLTPGDLKCDFDPETDPVSWFLDAFVPLFKDTLASALRGPITDVINDVIPPMPFPSSCSEMGDGL